MGRKFRKKAAPFGAPPPPTPGMSPKPPTSPPAGLGSPPPGPTPPKPAPGLTGDPGASQPHPEPGPGLKPRMPEVPEAEVPTDVHIDAATGHVTIKKGPVQIRVAQNPNGNPIDPSKFPQGEPCPDCQGLGIYMGGDCHVCGGTGIIEQEGDMDPWNYSHAPRDNFQDTSRMDRLGKEATHQDFVDFKANDNEPQYGDWSAPELAKDTHDNPFSHPKNRLKPPTFTVTATIPDYMNPRSIAYSLQTQTMLNVKVDGKNITMEEVADPIAIITELSEYGIEAEVKGDNLTKFDQGFDDFKLGQKVALLGDYEDMNYFYNPEVPPIQAMVVGIKKEGYVLRNDMWGDFEASKEEMGHV